MLTGEPVAMASGTVPGAVATGFAATQRTLKTKPARVVKLSRVYFLCRFGYSYFLNNKAAFVPPKPKLFDSE